MLHSDEPPADGRGPRSELYRYASLGLELAGAIVGLTLAGVWVDHTFGTGPTGVIVGASLGVVGGLYNFIRAALRMSAPRGGPPQEKREADDQGPEPPQRNDAP